MKNFLEALVATTDLVNKINAGQSKIDGPTLKAFIIQTWGEESWQRAISGALPLMQYVKMIQMTTRQRVALGRLFDSLIQPYRKNKNN